MNVFYRFPVIIFKHLEQWQWTGCQFVLLLPRIGRSCALDQSSLFSSDTQETQLDIKLVGLLLIPTNSQTTPSSDVEVSSWTVQESGTSSL